MRYIILYVNHNVPPRVTMVYCVVLHPGMHMRTMDGKGSTKIVRDWKWLYVLCTSKSLRWHCIASNLHSTLSDGHPRLCIDLSPVQPTAHISEPIISYVVTPSAECTHSCHCNLQISVGEKHPQSVLVFEQPLEGDRDVQRRLFVESKCRWVPGQNVVAGIWKNPLVNRWYSAWSLFR